MKGREQGVAFLVCFGAVAVLNASFIRMPPVWDAVGVFAPAVYLYESGFDLAGLLALPGYVAGGPNIHSLSLVTFLTWTAMWLSGGQPSLFLPGLHATNFAFAGLAAAITFSLSRRLIGGLAAAILTAAVLLFPPFLVQSGTLHTEMAGAALVMLGLASFGARRYVGMVVCAVASCGVKSFGLVLVVPLTVLIAADASMPRSRRVAWCCGLLLPTILVEATKWAAAPAMEGQPQSLAVHLDQMLSHLCAVPDLLVLLALALLACLHQVVRVFRKGLQASLDDDTERIRLAIALVPVSCLAFVAVVPLTGADFIPLHRYYVWILAPALIAVAAFLSTIGGRRVVAIALAGFVVYAGLNRSGRFYPEAGEKIRRFSIVERSYEYVDYFQVQLQGVRGVASVAPERPAFVTRGEYYYLASPLMGWVDRPVRDVHFVLEPPYDSGHLSHYPSDFYVLDADGHPYHGQRVVRSLVIQATVRTDWKKGIVAEWESGPYTAKLLRIQQKTDGSR